MPSMLCSLLTFHNHPCSGIIIAAFGHAVFIAEDLVSKDVNECLKSFGVVYSEQHPRSSRHVFHISVSEGCSSSSQPYISTTSPTVLEGIISELREEFLVNTRSEVVENKYRCGSVPIFFQG